MAMQEVPSQQHRSSKAVVVEHVNKTYGEGDSEVAALRDASLATDYHEFVSLIGPSGCGKTTLLNIVGGLLEPDSGAVIVHGERIIGPQPNIGLMFQTPSLLPWHTVLGNVLIPISIRDGRRAAKSAIPRAMELLDLAGLTGFEGAYPKELSGGMAQRASICRMLIADPMLLLLDEPFGALDELTRDMMNTELQRICLKAKATAIMVTHSIQEAVFLSDRVYVMSSRPGKIADVIEIDVPRPRDLDDFELTLGAYVTRVRRALHAMQEV